MRPLTLLLILPLALALGALACDGETAVDGPSPTSVTLGLSGAHLSRCNQMMSFAYVSFMVELENTGSVAAEVDGALSFQGLAQGATSMEIARGTAVLPAGLTLAAGASTRLACTPAGATLTWPAEALESYDGFELLGSAGYLEAGNPNPGTASATAALTVVEAYDNCDTFAPEPGACTEAPIH